MLTKDGREVMQLFKIIPRNNLEGDKEGSGTEGNDNLQSFHHNSGIEENKHSGPRASLLGSLGANLNTLHKSRKVKKDGNIKSYLKLWISGLCLMSTGILIYVANPLNIAREIALKMKDGSYLYSIWEAPPVKVYIKVYLFNVTNSERFIKGLDKKLKVNEIGPYVYSEIVTNNNVTWNENGTLSFSPTRAVEFERELSVGDPAVDNIIITNVPLLGVSSMAAGYPSPVSFALSSLISYHNTQPFLKMPVKDFLWGYDEPLIKLARNVIPNWLDFTSFGLLDRMLDEGDNIVTMELNETSSSQYSIQYFNGLPGLKQWGWTPENNRSCNMVQGTYEGIIFPSNIPKGKDFTVFRKAFCRPLKIVYTSSNMTEEGIRFHEYKIDDDAFDSKKSENSCYCVDGECPPKGLTDLAPCYYRIPVALSFPHFFNGDPKLQSGVEGLSPKKEIHGSYFGIQPDIGVPIYMKTGIQLNVVVKTTRFIPRVKKFNNMVIPIFWMRCELNGLPGTTIFLISLLLVTGPVLQMAAIVTFIFLGLSLILLANLRYIWNHCLVGSKRRATIMSIKRKHSQQDKIVRRRSSHYAQLHPLANSPNPPSGRLQ